MNFANFDQAGGISEEDDYDLKRGGKNGDGNPKRRRPSWD